MYYTEDEARRLLCPMRMTNTYGTTNLVNEVTTCVASKCMKWEWGMNHVGKEHLNPRLDAFVQSDKGYCNL